RDPRWSRALSSTAPRGWRGRSWGGPTIQRAIMDRKGGEGREPASPGPPSADEPLAPTAEAAGATTLRRNVLNMWEVLAQSVANMSPTGAMALLPLLIFISAGNSTWFTFIIATVLMVSVGYSCAQ